MQKLRILLIDNSILASEKIAQGLLVRLPAGSLVEKCLSAIDAPSKVELFRPNIILMNFALAVFTINGNPFLPALIRKAHLPVLAYGLLATSAESARALGASDYILKPEDSADEAFLSALALRAVAIAEKHHPPRPLFTPGGMLTRDIWASRRKAAPHITPTAKAAPGSIRNKKAKMRPIAGKPAQKGQAKPSAQKCTGKCLRLIAIGSSTGGPEALSQIIPRLTPPMPPIVIVQHIPATFSALFANRLDGECSLHVKEAVNGERLEPNTVYIAPGGKHMTVVNERGRLRLQCKEGPRVHNCAPSADVLFHSIASAVKNQEVLGVILTGMGRDGAAGLLEMREQGARTLGQDEATCVVYGMPRVAYEKGAVEKQLPLSKIADEITRIARAK